MNDGTSRRNLAIENAVSIALNAVDAALDGQKSPLPPASLRRAIDQQIKKRASIRLASFFFVAYSVTDPSWDCETLPTGLRGQFGDKKLAAELSNRSITLHDNITAFGENLGWKGGVGSVRLSSGDKFKDFADALGRSNEAGKQLALHYFAARFAESQRLVTPLPPLPPDYLTFARARALYADLTAIPSEGHVQQFVVAALLKRHRRRVSHDVRTHHPHAADKFDGAAGDVEEFRDGALVAAYEVTVRPDWKNRLPDFREKMNRFGLSKYVILASGVDADPQLAPPAAMLSFMHDVHADIAVVDLRAFVEVFLAELTTEEIRDATNDVHAFLVDPSLSNRIDFIDSFNETVERWLDES